MTKRLDITYGYDKNNRRITIEQLTEAIEQARAQGNVAPPPFRPIYPNIHQAAWYAITTGKQAMSKTTDEWARIAAEMAHEYQEANRERDRLVQACIARMKSWENSETDKEIARIAMEALIK